MKITEDQSINLTYCLNVHPGETWPENLEAINQYALQIKNRLAPDKPFGLGLRLSNRAARHLANPPVLARFKEFLREHDLYVFTINGFPYGRFHGSPVKENVYTPDWTRQERLSYTLVLADILSSLMPDDTSGSISTVPLAYKNRIKTDQDRAAMVSNLTALAVHLSRIEDTTGRYIHLGLEPEPDCIIENTEETVRFFNQELIKEGRYIIQRGTGLNPSRGEEILRRYVGVCFDTCHLATQFEDLIGGITLLGENGIKISKVQLSVALKIINPLENRAALHPFRDPVYLHQVKALDFQERMVSFTDLPVALEKNFKSKIEYKEWRIHFHVPLYFQGTSDIKSTADDLSSEFFKHLVGHNLEHWEIETYTFDVLPSEIRSTGLIESIAREYEWVLKRCP